MSRAVLILAGSLALITAVWAQRPFREATPVEYDRGFPMPKDFRTPGEWVFGRLMYPPVGRYYGGFAFLGSWKEGLSNWAMDYPRSDRHFAAAVRRLTQITARSVEQLVDLDEHEVYDWPWLYGVEVGHWDLTDDQAKTMREYLLRGGFFMCDDFHGAIEWDVFVASMRKAFPDRTIVDLDSKDDIFHVVYDLDDRYQIPGQWALRQGQTYRNDGATPHWRGIYDDKGRLMVAMSFNSDIGDSWEWADDAGYPEKYSALGIRIGVNDVIYSMSH